MSTCRVALIVSLALTCGSVMADELDLLPLGDPVLAHSLGVARAGAFFDCRAGDALDLEGLVDRLSGARVVLLGEEHTSLDQKIVQAKILDGLAERGRNLILGMEFFLRADRDALERWGRGEINGEQLLREVGWYDRGSYRFEYFAPILEVARRRGIAVVGLNVPREIPRTVNRKGLASLSDAQRTMVGAIDVDRSPAHRFLVTRYFGDTVASMPPGWLDNMYAAQCLWDVVMARSILAELADDTTLVAVAGAGHVAYGLGIAQRIEDELVGGGRAPVEVATYCPVTAPAPDPEGRPHGHPMGEGMGRGEGPGSPALFVRSLAQYVGVFPDSGGIEAYPSLGLRLKEGEGGAPAVRMAWPDSIAEGAGVRPGDRVLDVNGVETGSLSQLRLLLARLDWGDRLDLRVQRTDAVIDLAALLYPGVETAETTVAPGWMVESVAALDPPAVDAVVVGEPEAATVRRVRLAHDEVPKRVEVRSGDRLDEVHELGPAGRVMRSLYREPRPDGAVDVRYERSADGAVTGVTRFDRTGAEIRQM